MKKILFGIIALSGFVFADVVHYDVKPTTNETVHYDVKQTKNNVVHYDVKVKK